MLADEARLRDDFPGGAVRGDRDDSRPVAIYRHGPASLPRAPSKKQYTRLEPCGFTRNGESLLSGRGGVHDSVLFYFFQFLQTVIEKIRSSVGAHVEVDNFARLRAFQSFSEIRHDVGSNDLCTEETHIDFYDTSLAMATTNHAYVFRFAYFHSDRRF